MVIARLFPSFDEVRIAATREELDAVYRFRYTVYGKELGWQFGGVDHERQIVRDDTDEMDHVAILYAGEPDRIKGTARLEIFEPGEIPETFFEQFSLRLFPNIAELRICEIGRFMIRKTMRGKMVLPSMSRFAYRYLAEEKEVDLVFNECRPGLVHAYRRLGARPYGGDLIHTSEGLMVPMVSVLSDYEYFRSVDAIQTPQVKKAFGQGRREPVDTEPFAHLFAEDQRSIEYRSRQVWDEMEAALVGGGETEMPSLLDELSEKAVKRLSEHGLILDVSAGTVLIYEGRGEREIYVAIEGSYDVSVQGRHISTLEKGEVFGEIGFFRSSGTRSATVTAATDGRVLLLRKRFLQEFAKKDPDAAVTLLFNLGRVLAERLARATG